MMDNLKKLDGGKMISSQLLMNSQCKCLLLGRISAKLVRVVILDKSSLPSSFLCPLKNIALLIKLVTFLKKITTSKWQGMLAFVNKNEKQDVVQELIIYVFYMEFECYCCKQKHI